MVKSIAIMFLMAVGTTYAQQAKPSPTANEIDALVARNAELQRKVCESRTHLAADGDDYPECKGISPRYEVLKMLHQSCEKSAQEPVCRNLLPAPVPATVEDLFTLYIPKVITKVEAFGFFDWLINQANPKREENNYLPAKTKERMSFLFKLMEDKQLGFEVLPTILSGLDESTSVAMYSEYKDGKPSMATNLGYWASKAWDNYQQYGSIQRVVRTEFITVLSHEVIHLAKGPESFQGKKTREQHLLEEKRAWTMQILEDFRPLIEKGEIIREHDLRAHGILSSCGDNPDCPEFMKFVESHTPPEN